mgnify:CR=1 FL=1
MHFPYAFKVRFQRLDHGLGQNGCPVFIAFAAAHEYGIGAEVDIIHPQPRYLHQPHARAVKDVNHQQVAPR